MRKHLIFAFAMALSPFCAQSALSLPNDCWFGVMAADNAERGQLVASGPVMQWRVGMSLVFYPTKEDSAQIDALAEKGETGTFDISHPITVVATWISGPEPGAKDSDESNSIEVMLKYRNAKGESGTINLNLWTPMSYDPTAMSPDQTAGFDRLNQPLHDMLCRGIP